jgi:hypothetical protein
MISKKNICGEQIAKIRNSQTPVLTQEQLTAKVQSLGLDIDRAAIAKIETKQRRVYDYEVVIFAKALNISTSKLLGDE